jgi:hypothetical protein
MPERDGYIPGVPCALDTTQPDPEAAVSFYGIEADWGSSSDCPVAGSAFLRHLGDLARYSPMGEAAER